jgi:phage regulator Rha-like protein
MCLHCFSCHIVALIEPRHNTILRFIQNYSRILENENESKKNKKLDIFLFEFETNLLRSDHEPSLQAALLS